jgi:hypothetical protein
MNAKKFIAAVSMLVATGSVFAQQVEAIHADAGFVSTKTRAQVKAELEQAQANGTYLAEGEEFAGQTRAQATAIAKYMRNHAQSVDVARNVKSSPGSSGS